MNLESFDHGFKGNIETLNGGIFLINALCALKMIKFFSPINYFLCYLDLKRKPLL